MTAAVRLWGPPLHLPSLAMVFFALGAIASGANAATRIDLDQQWRYRTDPHEVGIAANWAGHIPQGTRVVDVPQTWNIGVDADHEGVAWYFKRFTVPRSVRGQHVELHFGATFYKSRVFLNGGELGGHEGGYTEYWFDLTNRLESGENVLAVAIDNRPAFDTIPGYAMRLAASKSVWYDWWHYGGIVRDVWLSMSDDGLIRRQWIDSTVQSDHADVTSTVFIENTDSKSREYTVVATATAPNGDVAATTRQRVRVERGGHESPKIALRIDRPHLWNIDEPQLYELAVELRDENGTLLDTRSDNLGLRRVEIHDRKLYVNGRQVRLSGIARHEDSPLEGLAETTGTIRRDWSDLTSLHTTLTRPVHYPQHPQILDWADRHGILLVPEIPMWQFSETQMRNPHVRALAEAQMGEMIREAGNHPSIFAWSVCNESDASLPGGREYVVAMRDFIHSLDPKRFVTFADSDIGIEPWKEAPVMHEVDFIMANAYFGSWSGAEDNVDPWLDFVNRTYPDKLVIISEFGYPGPFSPDTVSADEARIANMRRQIRSFESREFIGGMIFWCYQDYESHHNLWPGQTAGYVDHGLVDENRQRRPSYYVWKALNQPLSMRLQWRHDKQGLSGFEATLIANGLSRIPSYPLRNLHVMWRAIDGSSREVGHGDVTMSSLDQPGVMSGEWQSLAGRDDARLEIEVRRADRAVAAAQTFKYHALSMGNASFPAVIPETH